MVTAVSSEFVVAAPCGAHGRAQDIPLGSREASRPRNAIAA